MLHNYYILGKKGQFRELIKSPQDDTDACDDYIELFDYDCKFIACISRLTLCGQIFFSNFFLKPRNWGFYILIYIMNWN